MIKKNKKYLGIVMIVFSLLVIGNVFSQSTSWPSFNVCCEKTNEGAWCQNTLDVNCDLSVDPNTNSAFRTTPTSCDSTSFCKPGCCIDTAEGLCMENTPQKVCEISAGTWMDDSECNVPQCSLGCCLMGDQASYVTLTRCKKLSGFYGLETNFKRNIKDETNCILLAHLQDKGACVYEFENMKTCKFGTRAECLGTNKTQNRNITSQATFHKDYLCSADILATDCGPTTDTKCIDGKDEVYFIDSCGNPTNIYDATKTYDKKPSYWQKIVPKAQSCKFGDSKGNAGSKSCGNCEYFKGSICSGNEGKATYGDNICQDINCYDTENGNDYKNGESWCVDQGPVGKGRDLVGSRHMRHICINGEEIIEPCADFRNEICIENELVTTGGNFVEAACRPNRWMDCLSQDEEDDCLNTDKRDCFWILGAQFTGTTATEVIESLEGASQSTGKIKIVKNKGICFPHFPAGLKHWEDGESKNLCSLASTKETVIYEKGLINSKKKCSENCEVLTSGWASKMNNVCTSLGDCGAYTNIAGRFTDKGVELKQQGNKKVITGLLENIRANTG
ncbi:hypothetical protein GOV12_02545 [Candidatus Pacearchaeota archaeon]|nr:hypothetical protein [Candidatus Pacearchaeota archaeon]